MSTPRFTNEHRRAQIVSTAKSLSVDGGLYTWTLRDVAEHIGLTEPGVKYYFGSVVSLRAEVITNAVNDCDVAVVVQALAMHDPLVFEISDELRNDCAEYLRSE